MTNKMFIPSLLSDESHHSATGTSPLSSPHHPERAVSETLKKLQLRLPDQASERGSRFAAGCDRAGWRHLSVGLLRVSIRSFHWEHLRGQKQKWLIVDYASSS